MKILETERLILRQIDSKDFDALYQMNSDPEVMKYIGDGSIRNHEQMVNELDMLMSYYVKNPGLGIWAMVLKDTKRFVGASGLVYYDGTSEIEMGYRLLKENWNQGYATEVSFGLLKYGFKRLALKKIVSSAHIDNLASRRVMEKIGMRYIDDRLQYGCTQAYYEINADHYQT